MYRLSKLQFIKEFAAFEPTARRARADLWDLQQSRIERIYGVVAIPPKFAQIRSTSSRLPFFGLVIKIEIMTKLMYRFKFVHQYKRNTQKCPAKILKRFKSFFGKSYHLLLVCAGSFLALMIRFWTLWTFFNEKDFSITSSQLRSWSLRQTLVSTKFWQMDPNRNASSGGSPKLR